MFFGVFRVFGYRWKEKGEVVVVIVSMVGGEWDFLRVLGFLEFCLFCFCCILLIGFFFIGEVLELSLVGVYGYGVYKKKYKKYKKKYKKKYY